MLYMNWYFTEHVAFVNVADLRDPVLANAGVTHSCDLCRRAARGLCLLCRPVRTALAARRCVFAADATAQMRDQMVCQIKEAQEVLDIPPSPPGVGDSVATHQSGNCAPFATQILSLRSSSSKCFSLEHIA